MKMKKGGHVEMKKELFIVFNIDTEGPATETLDHIFKRVRNIFNVNLEPTQENLHHLQEGDISGIDGKTRSGIKVMLHPDRLAYLTNWDQIDKMLDRFMTKPCRENFPDSYGGGYVYNFFVVDRVGYDYNPRRRATGYHHVYDFYRSKIEEMDSQNDCLFWHFHGPGFVKHAHLDALNLSHTDHHVQVLSRRIIDRMDFPACFRPGMDHIRPDHNLFLEMWIPFDYSNQAADLTEAELNQKDNSPGRFGDWRRAPRDWIVYHPDYMDYQKMGSMKRYVARCLYTQGRFRPMSPMEADKAFARANQGQKTVMSFICHDNSDMTLDVSTVNQYIREAAMCYPDVKFKYCNAVEAMRLALDLQPQPPVKLDVRWNGNRLEVSADKELWGPQPFFCFRTWDCRYYHDNLDKQSDTEWTYTFDWQTIDLRAIAKIGLATNDDYGNTTIACWNAESGDVITQYRNVDK